jgi:outer membrane biosynthesis protein TonB
MKKHPEADALAARLAAAANQPVAEVSFPAPVPPQPEAVPAAPPESEGTPTPLVKQLKQRKQRRPKQNAQASEQPEDDTVPMSLRPRRELLTRYVLAASDRTRESGRVISAQQIMLEVLERGP